jgi:hypothetical protein
VPTAEKRLMVGFDGRPSTLSQRSTATFTLESVLDALAGDIRVALDLKHLAPGSQSAVSFGAVEPGPKGVDIDPLAVFTTFAPVPEVFTVKARAQRRDGQAPVYTAQVISAVPTTVTVQASSERTAAGDRRDIAAVLDKVPAGTAATPSMRVDLTEQAGTVLVDYAGSGPIGSFSFSDKHTPSVADLATFETLVTTVEDIPLSLHAESIAPFDVSYTAPTPVGAASVQLQETRASAVVAQLTGTAGNLPSRVRLVGDVTAAGDDVAATVTYDAAGEIRDLGFQLFDDRDVKAQVDATVASLPSWMQVKLVKAPHDSRATFDARTGPDAAPGSSSVGDIVVKYSSSGAHLTGLPAEDHVAMVEGVDSLQAALKYGGLSYVDYALHDDVTPTDRDTVRAELRNAQPRRVSLIGDTPGLSLNATVDEVPSRMSLDYAQQGKAARVHYNASSAIDSISAAVREKSATAGAVGLTVTGVPSDMVLTSNPVDGTVVWDAAADVAGVGVTGAYTTGGRTWNGSVGLTSIPSHWELSYSPARYAFTAGTAAAPRTVGAVHATLTNTGSVLVEPGNHAIVRYTEATGDLVASARLSDITGFSYLPSADGFEVNAKAGGGKPFHVDGEVVMGTGAAALREVIDVDAHLASLPTDITIRQAGEVLDYTGNASYDIDAVVGIGRADALAVTPAAPRVRGVSLRDGTACDAGAGCATAMKVHAFLQGAPTGLHADLSTVDYGLSGYRPPATDPTLNADVVMDDVPAADRLDVKATLAGIASAGQDLHLGPLTTGPGSSPGSEQIGLAFTANRSSGPLTAQLTRGPDTARFYLSNLPTSVNVSAVMEPQGITLTGTLAQPITRIEAYYRPTSMTAWALTAGLGDVPTSFAFSQQTVGGGGPAPDPCAPAPEPPPAPAVPIINYTASADTLDLDAGLDLAMFGMSGSVLAGVVDLGRSVTGSWDGTVLSLTSSPASGSISAHVPTAVVSIRKEFGTEDCPPSDDFVRFEFTGHIDIAVPIRNAGFSVTGLQSLVVRPGLSTGLQGDWQELRLGWSDIRTTIDIDLEGRVVVDFGGDVEVGVRLLAVDVSELDLPINVLFHVAKNVREPWMTVHSPVPCARAIDDWDWLKFDIMLQPSSDRAPTWNAITLADPTPATGDAWIVTPNPYGVLPTVAVEGLAGLFSSPFDKGLGGDFRC